MPLFKYSVEEQESLLGRHYLQKDATILLYF